MNEGKSVRIGIPSRSGFDVALFPLHGRKLVVFELGPGGEQRGQQVVDLPRDQVERARLIAETCDVLLTREANRDFLMETWSRGVDVLITDDRRAETALFNYIRGKARPFTGGPCACGG